MKTIGFIGGGRITKIFLQAFQNTNQSFEKIIVFDINESALSALKSKFPQINIAAKIEDVLTTELVILATHPPVIMETLEKIKDRVSKESIFLSLAPKFNIAKIQGILGISNVARMNPSASTIVNKGVNPLSFSENFDSAKKESVLNLFRDFGFVNEVSDSKIEAYAVISAMGHTYFNFQIQKLKELAVSFGMDESEAANTISNMLWGTTETLFKSGMNYTEVADLVPVKPLAEVEETIKDYYDQYLTGIFNKIKS